MNDLDTAAEKERIALQTQLDACEERIALLEETQLSDAQIDPAVQTECSRRLAVERETRAELRAKIAPYETGTVLVEGTARLQAKSSAMLYASMFITAYDEEGRSAEMEKQIGNRHGQARFDARATFAKIAWNGPREHYKERYLAAFTRAWHAHVELLFGERT